MSDNRFAFGRFWRFAFGRFWRMIFALLAPIACLMAVILSIIFVYGWNQSLRPTLMTTDETMYTLVRGIKQIIQIMTGGNQIPEFGRSLAIAFIAILPPVAVVIVFQSWFVKGLVESDK